MIKLPKQVLKKLIIDETLKAGSVCGDGNPFLVSNKNFEHYLFVKNISPAYFKGSEDITRVQLPSNSKFKEVIESERVFIILGFDSTNNVFVTWDPEKIKTRLNTRDNVSVYSRLSIQQLTKKEEFKTGDLASGDKFLVFKKSNLNTFLKNPTNFFSQPKNNMFLKGVRMNRVCRELNTTITNVEKFLKTRAQTSTVAKFWYEKAVNNQLRPTTKISIKLYSLLKKEISADQSKLQAELKIKFKYLVDIDKTLESGEILKAVSQVHDKHKDNRAFKDFTFKNWFDLVSLYYEKKFKS